MGFLQALGSKLQKGAAIGAKVLGTAASIGHKISGIGQAIYKGVNASPLGEMINKNPMLAAVNAGVGMGLNALNKAAYAGDIANQAISAASSGEYARAGKLAGSAGSLAYNTARNTIERTKQIHNSY